MGYRGWVLGTPELQADGRPAASEVSTSQSKALEQAIGGRGGQGAGTAPRTEVRPATRCLKRGTRQRLGLQEEAAL